MLFIVHSTLHSFRISSKEPLYRILKCMGAYFVWLEYQPDLWAQHALKHTGLMARKDVIDCKLSFQKRVLALLRKALFALLYSSSFQSWDYCAL